MAMESFKNNRKTLLGQDNNALVLLFAINTLVFVGIISLKIIYYLSGTPEEFFYRQVLNWLSLPAPVYFLKLCFFFAFSRLQM